MASRSGPHRFEYHTITAGRSAATSFDAFHRMHTVQHLSTAPPDDEFFVLSQQPGRRRVIIEDAHVLVHDEDRHRHGVKQHAMKSLIQKLNGKPVYNNAQFSKSGREWQQKKRG